MLSNNMVVFSILFVLMITTLNVYNRSNVIIVNQIDFIMILFGQSIDIKPNRIQIFSEADDVYYRLDY